MSNVFSDRRLAREVLFKLLRRAGPLLAPVRNNQQRRLEANRRLIEASLLFDKHWYLQKYPDVAQAGTDSLDHYLTLGWREGRDPGPMFSTSAYLKANEDVAKSGINPLLHFVQFGMAEGREGFGDRQFPFQTSTAPDEFGEPHDCASFRQPTVIPPIWCRASELDRAKPLFVAVGESGAGYAPDKLSYAAVQGEIALLSELSGYGTEYRPVSDVIFDLPTRTHVDAWYVNATQLRTRWEPGESPAVLRVFQCDSSQEGQIRLVGEGLISTPLDFLDVRLLNPYFPLLFIFSTIDGVITSSTMFGFPSLCRGGTHYAESLWASASTEGRPLDVAAESQKLTEALTALIRQNVRPVVGRVVVSGADADGSGPLFGSDLRTWLDRVVQVDLAVEGLPGSTAGGEAPANRRILRGGGATLVIPAAAAPTISALLSSEPSSHVQSEARPVGLLTSRIDPSQPTMLIDVPAMPGKALTGMSGELPWLRQAGGRGVPKNFPAGAIRIKNTQALSDAQLLMPISRRKRSHVQARRGITWLIYPDRWHGEQFRQAIQTVALQHASSGDALALVGASAQGSLELVRRLFPGRSAAFSTHAEATARLDTPLAGCIENGVLLHDPGTADCFSALLLDERVTTASCVIVTAEKRSGVVKTSIVDGGAVIKPGGHPAAPSKCAITAEELWTGSYPVLRPSAHLWATRSALLKGWTDGSIGERPTDFVHLCTSAVTASVLQKGTVSGHFPDPPAAPETATRVEWLVG